MKIYRDLEKSEGPCEYCKKVAATTYKYAPYSYKGRVVADVLQEFCNECGNMIAIPQQSSARLREYREANLANVSVRVPKHLVDILYLIGRDRRISADEPNTVWRILSTFYLWRMRNKGKKELCDLYQEWVSDDLSGGKADAKLASRFDEETMTRMNDLVRAVNGKPAQILRGVIVAAKHDLLDKRDKGILREFEETAFALR